MRAARRAETPKLLKTTPGGWFWKMHDMPGFKMVPMSCKKSREAGKQQKAVLFQEPETR